MALAIKVENISKAYRLGEIGTGTIKADFQRWYAKARGKEDPFLSIGELNDRTVKSKSNVVWSLKDVNFSVEQGSAVGIIGKNGAGKSTLLKLLSRVTTPTIGKIKMRGRIASLLEVGTGFHPELTGRENIFLNGAVLGMRKKEIARKFDEIVAFSGVERYIDTPVRRYSSGMYVRLAFAVAAYLESEILIVDEVLAVGDIEFQKKCLGKMGEVSQGEGRTVLFVSHNMDAVLRLCNTCIFLKHGSIIETGNTDHVISTYLSAEANLNSFISYPNLDTAPGDDFVKLLKSEVIDDRGSNKSNFPISEKVGVRMTFQVMRPIKNLVCGFNLYNKLDVHILSSHDLVNYVQDYNPGIYQTTVWIPGSFLSEGMHYCGIAAMSVSPFTIHFHDINKFAFNVVDNEQKNIRSYFAGEIPGIVRPMLDWDAMTQLD